MGAIMAKRTATAKAGALAAALLGNLVIATTGSAQVLDPEQRGPEPRGPQPLSTLQGCNLPLPGGAERDAGLAALHLRNRDGRPYLLTPSLTFRQTYSDNITLSDSNKESDFVSQLIPAISFCNVGRRVQVQADYRAELLKYWDDSSRDDVFQQANIGTRSEIIRERLFLDVDGSFGQEPITTRGAFSSDNALDTGNRADVATYRFSPYFLQDLGPVGSSVTRYTYQRREGNRNTTNTTRQSGSFLVTSPQAAQPYSWQGSVQTQKVSQSNFRRDRYFDDAFIELGYFVRPRIQLIARGGLETETRRDGTQNRFGDEYWEAGFRYNDEKTRLEARYGQRFFGDTYFFSASRQTAIAVFQASYRETQEISDRFFLSDEQFFIDFDPETGELDLIPLVDIEQEVFISKRANASATVRTGRSTIRLSGFHQRRELIEANESTTNYGGDLFWRWQWMPRTTLTPRVSWRRQEFREGDSDTTRGIAVSAAHLLSPTMQGGVTLRRQERSSDRDGSDYTENAIIFEITRVF